MGDWLYTIIAYLESFFVLVLVLVIELVIPSWLSQNHNPVEKAPRQLVLVLVLVIVLDFILFRPSTSAIRAASY